MQSLLRLICWVFISTVIATVNPAAAVAGELKLKAQLVWGTDDPKPPSHDYKELEPKIRDNKLRHLRWKNYYVVKAASAVAAKDARKVELSERCTLSIRDAGNGTIEVSIFNPKSAKPAEAVKTDLFSVDALKKGDVYIFGGASKDRWDDAWLVIVSLAE